MLPGELIKPCLPNFYSVGDTVQFFFGVYRCWGSWRWTSIALGLSDEGTEHFTGLIWSTCLWIHALHNLCPACSLFQPGGEKKIQSSQKPSPKHVLETRHSMLALSLAIRLSPRAKLALRYRSRFCCLALTKAHTWSSQCPSSSRCRCRARGRP